MTVRFDAALRDSVAALQKLSAQLSSAGRLVLVRDLFGKLTVLTENEIPLSIKSELHEALTTAAGIFFSGRTVSASEILGPDTILDNSEIYLLNGISILDQGVTIGEFHKPLLMNHPPSPPRATFYGIKGGVGRSTALVALATHLSEQGKKVLVIDLDLESPGISSSLLHDRRPDFGVVDWFVEEAVGNCDEALTAGMVMRSDASSVGDIMVVPAYGSPDGYISKLSRVQLELAGSAALKFGDRLAKMIDELEMSTSPDVVLMDSRGGLHDMAGVAITRLDAHVFLFAGNSAQTWAGYRLLFDHWAQYPVVARHVRTRLQVVASLVPETGREAYLNEVLTRSYDALADTLYEESGPQRPNVFNFDIDASEAPHYPVPIYWSRLFQEWTPLRRDVTGDQIRASYGRFIDYATELLTDERSEAQSEQSDDDVE
jgi:cellulose biosynthesis protein BcsQ